MEKILVAIDGSKNADRALTQAKKIGAAFNSKITILHVMKELLDPDVLPALNVTKYAVLADAQGTTVKEKSVKLLEACKATFEDYNGEIDTLSKAGIPGDIISKIAKEEGYTLIVIGSRGLGAVSGAMLGSVSAKVVHESTVPVLVVK